MFSGSPCSPCEAGMTAPALLQIRPMCVYPPCITASSWPSHVSVTLAVSMADSRYPGASSAAAMSGDHEDIDLFRPWLLSAFQDGSEQALPRQVPTCVHSSSEEVMVTFKDLEVTALVPGVISLALCPSAPAHGAGQKATIEAIPLMVSPNAGGSDEAVAMFDCMKQLVQQQEHTQQQHHDSSHHHQQLQDSQQVVDCCAAAGSCGTSSAPASQCRAGMAAPDALSFKMPCPEEQAAAATAAACVPGACCAHCNFGKAEAAVEQALLRSTWQQNFLPLLLDMHAALTCAPKRIAHQHQSAATSAEQIAAAAPDISSTRTFAAAARIPNALEGWAQHNTGALLHPFSPGAADSTHAAAAADGVHVAQPAILLELAGCAPPPVDVAGQMLICVVEFLALHNCWCNVSFLLVEAFKNGLLATTGVLAAQKLQRLHELQRMQAPVCSAALTAASLVASLAEGAAAADEEEAAEVEAARADAAALGAEPAARQCTAGSLPAHSSPTNTSSSAIAASAPAIASTISPAPASAAFKATSVCSHRHAPSAGHTAVLAVLLLLFMPAAALLLAAAAGSGEMSVQCVEAPNTAVPCIGVDSIVAGMLPSGLAAAAPALQVWLYTALLSVMLLVMVVVSCSRNALRMHV